jgi:hypothetical protein
VTKLIILILLKAASAIIKEFPESGMVILTGFGKLLGLTIFCRVYRRVSSDF